MLLGEQLGTAAFELGHAWPEVERRLVEDLEDGVDLALVVDGARLGDLAQRGHTPDADTGGSGFPVRAKHSARFPPRKDARTSGFTSARIGS